jgi:hypothetical protein
MKPDDIRKANELCQNDAHDTESIGSQEMGMLSLQCSMLTEIAAQLAEANEYLKMYSNPPLVFEGTNINPPDFSDSPQQIFSMTEEVKKRLRDEFAMAALGSIISGQVNLSIKLGEPMTKDEYEKIAQRAYRIADQMMEARNGKS